MKFYLGRPSHPPTTLAFNGGIQDIQVMWGVAFGMTFIGVIRAGNTCNRIAPAPK
jgi:hypothetical protein